TTQNQGNANWTDQEAVQVAAQDQHTGSAPSRYEGKSGCGCNEHSTAPSQRLDQDQDVENTTHQENEAWAISPTVAVGNNLALINGGDQTTNAGTTQNQGNFKGTDQTAVQTSEQDQHAQSQGSASQSGEQDQDVENRTSQENKAVAIS